MKIGKILLALTLVIMSGTASAQTLYKFGFCSGFAGTESRLTIEGATSAEAAIFISAEELERFSGDSFAGVNAALTSKMNVHDMTAWIRKDLNGENLAEQYIDIRSTQKPRDGWNSIQFDTPVVIEPGTGYYVGYTFNQTKTASAISFVDGDYAGASWIRTGEGNWSERADLGILSIEALITGENLPQNDMQLISASLSDDYYVIDTPVSMIYEIRNNGVEPVSVFTLTIADEEAGISVSHTVYQTVSYGVTRSYKESFVIPGVESGKKYRFTATVSKPNGSDDETPEDNSVVLGEIPVLATVFPRTVLLEEFTTEKCSNCPAAAETVHDMIATFTDDQKKRFAMVCHHSGYGIDAFTQPCDKDYIWFYNNGGSMYAPAFMLDREGQTGSSVRTPVFSNLPVNAFAYKVTQAQDVPALYSVTVSGTHDATSRKLHVKVEGEEMLATLDNPRITVYVVEDNVLASNDGMGQSGSGGAKFYHNHVERAYNDTWGESAEWNGNKYTYECELEYPEGCKTEDMQVVAFISNRDETDPVNCEVGNAAWKELADFDPSGIDGITNDSGKTSAMIYDLSGSLTRNSDDTTGLPAGVFIVKKISGGKSTTSKVIVR